MSPALRIAVVDREESGLSTLIGEVPGNARLRVFPDLIGEADALRAWHPDILLVSCQEGLSPTLQGALQVLRVLLPQVHLVIAVPAAHELADQAAAESLRAKLLPMPTTRAALLDALLPGPQDDESGDSDVTDTLALVRGLADEINNPLLFATGHLQLLETMCEDDDDESKLDQVVSIRRGLQRISQTMDKIRTMSRARSLLTPLPSSPIRSLFDAALDDLPRPVQAQITAALQAAVPEVEVPCDAGLLTQAIARLLEVGVELRRLAEELQIEVAVDTAGGWFVRMDLIRLDMEGWQLPETFAPYHLRGALRGTVHGLNLFLVQRVVSAHGGIASAQRIEGDIVRLQLEMPRTS